MERGAGPRDRTETPLNGWSIAGLAVLNAFFLLTGLGMLWGLRGWEAWTEVLRLSGIAYLLGAASIVLPSVWLLTVGVGPSVPLVLAIGLVLGGGGVLAGRSRPRPRLRSGQVGREPYALVAAACFAVTVVWLEAYFRVARASGLEAFDAWAFWVPKAQAIYHWGGLDDQLFRELPGQTYPILVPTLEAIAFHFMGSADTNVLHVQFWALLAGFVGALAGLLRPRVPLVVIGPFLAALVLMPAVGARAIAPQADLTLNYFFVAGALSLAVYFREREHWQLATFGVLLAAAMSTKREGQLLVACLLVAALIVTARDARRVWPRLAAVGTLAFVATLPWRFWFTSRDLRGEGAGASLADLWNALDRVPPSLRLVLELALGSDLWLAVLPVACAAAVAGLVFGRRRTAGLFLLTALFGVLGFTWILWSIAELPIAPTDATPIPRAVGALVLLAVAFAPLLVWELLEER